MLLAACHGSCSISCSVSLQWIQRSLDYDQDPLNTDHKIPPIDWQPRSGVWQLTPVVIQSWFWYRGRKNTRKRPKHFAIYLDKTLLIPVRVAGCGNLSGWLMFMAGEETWSGAQWSLVTDQQGYIIRVKMIRGCAWLFVINFFLKSLKEIWW